MAFTYAVNELKRDTDAKTCALAVKIGIARAINDYLQAVEEEKKLENITALDTEDQIKQKEEGKKKVARDKERALNRRNLYEAAEKNIWKSDCAKIELEAMSL